MIEANNSPKIPYYISKEAISHFVKEAIKEDIADGDHSTLACVSSNIISRAKCIMKQEGVLAGVDLAKIIFEIYDNTLSFTQFKSDGDKVEKGDIVFEIKGNPQSILAMERLVLNCMQRMSGIATMTHKAVEILKNSKTKLLDTRKTTPLFRIFEKWAVFIGGGKNHRMGLYDMIMLKDNHIDYAGGITKAIEASKNYLNEINKNLKIEVETRNLDEVKEVLQCEGVDIVMLDNMSAGEMKKAVELIDGRILTEASGNITPEKLAQLSDIGVDYISSGAIIYSAPIIDISLIAVL